MIHSVFFLCLFNVNLQKLKHNFFIVPKWKQKKLLDYLNKILFGRFKQDQTLWDTT